MLDDIVRKKIRSARIEKNIKQQDFALMLDLSLPHYQKIEYGSRNATVETLYRAAHILGFSIDGLFFPEQNENALLSDLKARITQCNDYELRILLATVEAMLSQRENKPPILTETQK